MVRLSAPGDAASSGVRTACALSGKSGAGDAGVDADVPNTAREGSVARSQQRTSSNVRRDNIRQDKDTYSLASSTSYRN